MRRPPGRWIPPQGLIFGQLAHGASWIALLVLAVHRSTATGLAALGWVHLVALGWLTMTALSVLVHVVPAFTDVAWRWESVARRSLAVYGAGVLVLVGGFFGELPWLLPWGGTLVGVGLAGYAVPAAATLAGAFRLGGVEAAIARALGVTLAFLLATALLGVAFTWMLDGRLPASMLVRGVPVHAAFGLIGWLSALVMGVSTRTVVPITGGRSPQRWRHVTAAAATGLGMLALAGGAAFHAAVLLWAGAVVLGAGVVLYVADIADVLRRATVHHRPPQAFLAAAVSWLAIAFVLLVAVLCGMPWGAVLVYVTLIGWLGQMVNGHLHHIGIRLLATAFRGDDDETRPDALLSPALSWTAFVLFQAAVAAGAAGLLLDRSGVVAGAAFAGVAGWSAMCANGFYAARRARRPEPVISLLDMR